MDMHWSLTARTRSRPDPLKADPREIVTACLDLQKNDCLLRYLYVGGEHMG